MISVVIPTFNEERFLPQCLESLQNQDYEGDYEIIVVDNASTDSTSKVAREFEAKVVFCPERGVVYDRQAGDQAASGDIIAQADADTTYPGDWLSRIAQHFTGHPHSVALAGTFTYHKNLPWWARFEYVGRYLLNSIGRLLLGRPVCISGANFAFRREAFLKANGYDPGSLYPDQWGISRRLSRVGKITYDKTLVAFTSTRRVEVTWSDAGNEAHNDLIFGKPLPKEVARDSISKAKPGRILLLHDGYGANHGDAKSDKSLTVQILPSIIEELQKQGYKFVTVPELLDIPAYNK